MAVFFNEKTNTFYLEGRNSSYVMGISQTGYLQHLYYGERIPRDNLSYYAAHYGSSVNRTNVRGEGYRDWDSYACFAPELAFFGISDNREPCVMANNYTGDRLSQLLYDGYEILPQKPQMKTMPCSRGGETLVIHLSDKISGFGADLYYTAFDDSSSIARRIVYKNPTDKKIVLDRAYSFSFMVYGDNCDMITLEGSWARERKPQRVRLHRGVTSIDSKVDASSAELNPFMAIVDGDTTEFSGDAYGVSLIYTGSYVLKAEVTQLYEVLLTGGINDFDFSWQLDPGSELETPEVLLTYSSQGIGGMSRELHDAIRNHIVPQKHAFSPRPMLINNWEGTEFHFDEEKLKSIIDGAADTGINMFVLDDGWFGVRNGARSGLGDWKINYDKLPNGLSGVIEYAKSKGMDFGLWFEPEMISRDSDLFRMHPDWAIGAPGRERCEGRFQYALDLTRKDVRDFVVDAVNSILADNDIKYVKWDYNRYVSEFYSFKLPADRQKEFAHRYALGVYDLFERIVNANPDVFFEGCASGGARFDLSVLSYFPQIWCSDNSDANDRVNIQYGTSIAYPLSTMSCHYTKAPKGNGRMTSPETRSIIAQLGATGYELDASNFTDEDREMVREQIKEYKKDESLVLEGDLYRLKDPFKTNFFAQCIVAKDKSRACLVVFKRLGEIGGSEQIIIKPMGLDENTLYNIPELGLTLTGKTIMHVGLICRTGIKDYTALKYHIEKV